MSGDDKPRIVKFQGGEGTVKADDKLCLLLSVADCQKVRLFGLAAACSKDV